VTKKKPHEIGVPMMLLIPDGFLMIHGFEVTGKIILIDGKEFRTVTFDVGNPFDRTQRVGVSFEMPTHFLAEVLKMQQNRPKEPKQLVLVIQVKPSKGKSNFAAFAAWWEKEDYLQQVLKDAHKRMIEEYEHQSK
jgi:hypothetical protein